MGVRKIMLILSAIILGEISLIIGTTIAQEVIFDGIIYGESSLATVVIGGILTVSAAILAGWMARLLWLRGHFVVPLVICTLISLETWYLVANDKTTGPLWFSILAALGLILGIIIGYTLIGAAYARRRRSAEI